MCTPWWPWLKLLGQAVGGPLHGGHLQPHKGWPPHPSHRALLPMWGQCRGVAHRWWPTVFYFPHLHLATRCVPHPKMVCSTSIPLAKWEIRCKSGVFHIANNTLNWALVWKIEHCSRRALQGGRRGDRSWRGCSCEGGGVPGRGAVVRGDGSWPETVRTPGAACTHA